MTQSTVQPLRRWDPERIGPYTIIGKLGAGAMGQVFLARSTAGRLVAVKTIRIELAEEPGFRGRFAREVAAARRVSGVFTAAVIESDAEADIPWVATAYVPAPSLSTLVHACGPLPVPAVRWLAAGCAEALQSIHGIGLLHRDVKPSNVLVAPDGPRVIDFGVAKATERIELTATRGAAGTPAYMAPEQARDATQASPASDVFSLGATLVFAATGHPPYQGETAMDILVRLATEPPDLTGMPAELTDLVAACLQRVPRDRPTDPAILGQLGSFAYHDGPGHSYLPASAMTLITEYQHNPRFAAQAATDRADGDYAGGETNSSGFPGGSGSTAGSHTALPGFESPAAFQASQAQASPAHPGQGQAGQDHAAAEPAGRRPPARRARWLRARRSDGGAPPEPARPARPARRALAWTGWVATAVLLIAAGTAIGLLLRGPGAQAADSRPGRPGSPPCTAPQPSSAPRLCVSQPYGDGDTVYVIHGNGFAPYTPVTVRLADVGVSPDQPVTDRQGTFNYAIDQGHYFFAGPIPAGTYTAVASTPDGRRAAISFRVYKAGAGPPPSAP